MHNTSFLANGVVPPAGFGHLRTLQRNGDVEIKRWAETHFYLDSVLCLTGGLYFRVRFDSENDASATLRLQAGDQ